MKDIKGRQQHALRLYGSLLLAGLAYLAFCLTTGLRLPCPFYTVTGLLCPGCGITRMMLALARLDFTAAYAANPAVLLTGPLLLVLAAKEEYHWIKTGRRLQSGQWLYMLLLLFFTIFTIWRNLP